MRLIISHLIMFTAGVFFAVAVAGKHPPQTASAPTHKVAQYPNGAVQSEYDVDSEGHVHGRLIEYHRNGEVAVIQVYEHGVATGVSEHYDEDGNAVD